jgi:chromate reductase
MPRFTMLAASGSLRAGSSNTGLVHMAARLAPADLHVIVHRHLDELPYYNADLDTPDALPEPVAHWRRAVAAADALWLAVPEYNWGPSAVLKNAVDWLTRPLGTHTLQGKVISLVTSGGKGGGNRVQPQLAEIIGLLGNVVVTEPPVMISFGAQRIQVDGTTTDPEVEQVVSARLDAVLRALEQRPD